MLFFTLITLGIAAVIFLQTETGIAWQAVIVVRIRAGHVTVVKGALLPHARAGLAEVVRAAGIERGFLAVKRNREVAFSRNIPGELRQRLRNVLLN